MKASGELASEKTEAGAGGGAGTEKTKVGGGGESGGGASAAVADDEGCAASMTFWRVVEVNCRRGDRV